MWWSLSLLSFHEYYYYHSRWWLNIHFDLKKKGSRSCLLIDKVDGALYNIMIPSAVERDIGYRMYWVLGAGCWVG